MTASHDAWSGSRQGYRALWLPPDLRPERQALGRPYVWDGADSLLGQPASSERALTCSIASSARLANSDCRYGVPGPWCQERPLDPAALPADSPAAGGLQLAATGRLDNPGSSGCVFIDPGEAVQALSVN